MPIINLNFEGNPPLIPESSYQLFKTTIDLDLAQTLGEIVLKERLNILNNTPTPPGANPAWLTGKFWYYNLLDLDYPEIKRLYEYIRQGYIDYTTALGISPGTTYLRCWANVIKFKQQITWHNHSDATFGVEGEYPYISGNICIHTHGTSTHFRSPYIGGAHSERNKKLGSAPIENVNGEMILFPSWIFHQTDVNETLVPRVTISFDIINENVYLNRGENAIFRKLT
jgi:hypothetical protein